MRLPEAEEESIVAEAEICTIMLMHAELFSDAHLQG